MSVKDAARFLQLLVKTFEANVVEKNETADGVVGHAQGYDASPLAGHGCGMRTRAESRSYLFV
jgi:hypothetical protein